MRAKRRQIILSVGCGLLAAVLTWLYTSSVWSAAEQSRAEQLAAYGGAQIEVYVALRDIAVGEQLTTANVSRQVWLADLLPAGALSSETEVIGQTVAVPLLRNEPIVAAKLGNTESAISVPEGCCAISIPTSDVLAVGGAIQPGSKIAVYASEKDTVRLLAADVLVLATSANRAESSVAIGSFGSNTSRPALAWVTLAVPEDRVEELIATSRSQTLYLVLPGGH